MKHLTEPGLVGVALDPGAIRAEQAMQAARLADSRHADLISVNDEPCVAGHLEAWTLLSVLAARTERVAVLPNVVSLPMRAPALLAKIAATFGGQRRSIGDSVFRARRGTTDTAAHVGVQ